MKSHMPPSLLASLGSWFQDLMILLEMVVLEKKLDSPEQEPRLKIWKRSLQICCNLVARHRKHVDKYETIQLVDVCVCHFVASVLVMCFIEKNCDYAKSATNLM